MHDTMSFRNDCTCLPVCSLFFFALTVPAFEMQSQQIRVVSNTAPVFTLPQLWTCWNEAWASELRERLSSVTRGGTWWMKLKTRERAATVMCVTFSVEITTLGLINNREGRVGAKSCAGWTGSGSLDNDGQEGIQQQLINSALETDTLAINLQRKQRFGDWSS